MNSKTINNSKNGCTQPFYAKMRGKFQLKLYQQAGNVKLKNWQTLKMSY